MTGQQAIGAEGSRHTKRWTATVASQAQIDVRYLLRDDDLVDLLSIRSEEFNRLIKNLSNDVLDRIERQTLGSIFEGRGQADIAKSLQEIEGIGRNRARLIARDQASKLNGAMNQFRQEQAGITHYKWKTILDGRERPSHNANNNKIFAWNKPPQSTGHPGHEINCRCRGLAVITDDPEDLAELPELPGGDFFDENLPALRQVGPTPSQGVFGFEPEQIAERLAQTRQLQANVGAVGREFTELHAERLVIELYGFKPSDDDLRGLLSGFKNLTASRRTVLIEAAKARLEMTERLLLQAALSPPELPPTSSPAVAPAVTPVAAPATPATPTRSTYRPSTPLPRGAYSERLSGQPRSTDDAVKQSRAFVVKEGTRTGNEWMIAHDDLGRDIMRMSSGRSGVVRFNSKDVPELFSPDHKITLHHNHPSSMSFSIADIEVFASAPGLDVIWAHGHNGSTYRATVANRKLIAGQIKNTTREFSRTVRAYLRGGSLTEADVDLIANDTIMVIMSNKGYIEYQRTLKGVYSEASVRLSSVIEAIIRDTEKRLFN